MVCKLAGVLVDLVIVLPDVLSGSDTSALSENSTKNFIIINRLATEVRCQLEQRDGTGTV